MSVKHFNSTRFCLVT